MPFCYAGTGVGGIPMSRTAIAISTVMLFFHFAAFTQNTRNFSGTWKSDAARSESAHQAIPIGPITLIISQTATEISIETKTRVKDRPLIANEKLIYRLDGAETTMAGNSGAPIVCKAHWDGADLVTETVRNLGSTVTTSWVLRMDARGKELTIKKTLTVQHGYQSPDAKNVGTGTDIFVKTRAGTNK
jgi:hypothetical protein